MSPVQTISTFQFLRSIASALALLLGLGAAWSGPELPRNSLYQLNVTLTDQDGKRSNWQDGVPGPRIVSMFYTRCEYVCPMLFEAIRSVESNLPADARQQLRVGLVTLDPARDDVSALKKTADQRAGDQTRWRVYRTDDAGVRKLAGLLGIQYRRMSDGEFNHSTVMILLDANGVELARTTNIAKADPVFVKAVLKATQARH
jgi:protein SCO1